ncbi:MAG: UDP-N-acetylmuramoyl-tripeptide--D-alanyl-D-alanine ligase [Betaproteobacteria bacterium RBG_19FT_COMBO_58_11]|nr:MAG: UDP-N-acetylmuramoyl-tripeptide--D-alanyl-D-alanine ligase [Betaproteobacteria bacterium RBG_19FT_COMBO_58_11]
MMRLSEAARAIGGATPGADAEFVSVGTDTRTLQRGALFIALRGERFDGHDFVRQALECGAAGVMVDSGFGIQDSGVDEAAPLIVVEDTRLGLGKLAAAWRNRFDIPLIAVTGSNGKTTVKEMLASILRVQAGETEAVLATEGNLNNDIGMPLMLLRLRASHRYAVIEMGMNHLGEIDYLTHLAQPTVALVNNAQAAHIGELGGIENVARAKGEIYGGLREGGVAVINADDSFAPMWRALNHGREIIDFALEHAAKVTGRYEILPEGSQLEIKLPEASISTRLQVPGVHNVRNALAASAAACAVGATPDAIARGLSGFEGVKGRLQRKMVLHGATLIDDTYNANPGSVRAAIDVLAQTPGEKILVLGDMGELGEDSAQLHAEIGRYAKALGVDALFCLGEMSRHAAQAFGANAWYYERIQELLADLENRLTPEVTVLVKGSRFMEMERVVRSFEIA